MTSPTLVQLTERLHRDLDRPERDPPAPGSPWSLSQTLQHCARTVRHSVTGYPQLRPALFRAAAGTLAKSVFLRRGTMKHPLGAEIDGAPPPAPRRPTAAAGFTDAVVFTGHMGEHAPTPPTDAARTTSSHSCWPCTSPNTSQDRAMPAPPSGGARSS